MSPLTAEQLLEAYAMGIFPMARDRADPRVYWVNPKSRGIIPLDKFHVPRSLKKTLRHGAFSVTCDKAFERIIRLCAEPVADRPQTWINAVILRLFVRLNVMGAAHSVEVWKDGELVGGLYGLALGAAFFGESMVSRATDASKVALVHLVARLRLGGFTLLDTQFVTEHLARFGAIEIPRDEYLERLSDALRRPATFYGDLGAGSSGEGVDPLEALFSQSLTQMS